MKNKKNPKIFFLVLFGLWFGLAVYQSINGTGSS